MIVYVLVVVSPEGAYEPQVDVFYNRHSAQDQARRAGNLGLHARVWKVPVRGKLKSFDFKASR